MCSQVESRGTFWAVAAGAVVLGGSLVGCVAPIPLVRLYPSAQNVVWVSGRASVEQEDGGIRVAAAFDHQDGTLLSVRIEVENRTDARVEVDPANVTFSACKTLEATSCSPAQQVVNPERVLDDLDEKQSREAAAAVNDEVFLGTLVLLSAVGDVASAGHGNHRMDRRRSR
jgi:hypothetical protein